MPTPIENEVTRLLSASQTDIRRIISSVYTKIKDLPPDEQIRVLRETSATVTRRLVESISTRLRVASQSGSEWASSILSTAPTGPLSGIVSVESPVLAINRIVSTYRASLVKAIETNISNENTIQSLIERMASLKIKSPTIAKEIKTLIRTNGSVSGPAGRQAAAKILKRLDATVTTPTDAAWKALAKAVQSGNQEIIAKATKWFIRDKTLYQLETYARTETVKAFVGSYEKTLEESGLVDEVEWVTADDDRVCDECNDLDGERFPIGEGPRPGSIHPRCRCSLIAVIDKNAAIKRIVREELSK